MRKLTSISPRKLLRVQYNTAQVMSFNQQNNFTHCAQKNFLPHENYPLYGIQYTHDTYIDPVEECLFWSGATLGLIIQPKAHADLVVQD